MNRSESRTVLPGRRGAAWACVLALLVLLPSCEKKSSFTPPPPKVTVAQPFRHNVMEYLDITGNTQAVNTVQLRARVEGYLDKILFRDGDLVKKDQPLFVIQQDTYVARLKQAEGNVQTQKALLDHAQTEYARYTGLFAQKAAAQTDVENWRFQKDSALAGLMTAEAQRDLAKLDLGYTTVNAPFAGRIDRRLVDIGNLVGAGSATSLAELTQTDPLYVYFNVSETAAGPLLGTTGPGAGKDRKARQSFFMGLASEQGYPHEGYLDFSATTVSTTTGTVLFRGVLSNPDGRMLPGQFARVRVPIGVERSAVLIPKVAVAFDQIGSYVLVVDGNNVVERRSVRTGPGKEAFFAIEEGLKGDEWVVVKGLLKAIPGRQVSPEREVVGLGTGGSGGAGQAAASGEGAGAGKAAAPAGTRVESDGVKTEPEGKAGASVQTPGPEASPDASPDASKPARKPAARTMAPNRNTLRG